MDEQMKKRLFIGLDEYYAHRTDLMAENNTPQKTVEINGITHIVVDCTAEEWIQSVGGVSIDDIRWGDVGSYNENDNDK